MRYLLFSGLFLIVLIVTLVLTTPLGFVLRQAGGERLGLEWETAKGTLTNGSLSGLSLGGEWLGEAQLKLQASGLLRGWLQYHVSLDGPSGRGSGSLAFAGNAIEASDLRAEVRIASLRDVPGWLHQNGGTVRVRADRIRFQDMRCAEATGTSWSDALSQEGRLLGAGWPELTGLVRCDGGSLLIHLSGERAGPINLAADTWLNLEEHSRFEARVSGVLSDTERLALAYGGFVQEGAVLVYRMPDATGDPDR